MGKERSTKSFFATTCPQKGGEGRFELDKFLAFVKANGDEHRMILIKGDPESAIKKFMNDVVRERGKDENGNARTVGEGGPVASKGSNGIVEKGVQEVVGVTRRIFLSFSGKLGCRVDAKERLVAWIPEYAAYLLNRLLTVSYTHLTLPTNREV